MFKHIGVLRGLAWDARYPDLLGPKVENTAFPCTVVKQLYSVPFGFGFGKRMVRLPVKAHVVAGILRMPLSLLFIVSVVCDMRRNR